MSNNDVAVLDAPDDMAALAHRRVAELVDEYPPTTLDDVLRRLFDRDRRERLTYSAFGSAL